MANTTRNLLTKVRKTGNLALEPGVISAVLDNFVTAVRIPPLCGSVNLRGL